MRGTHLPGPGTARTIRGSRFLPVALVIAVIYIGLCLILAGISRLVERRLARGPRSSGTHDPDLVAPPIGRGVGA